jgi:hypothetical protein
MHSHEFATACSGRYCGFKPPTALMHALLLKVTSDYCFALNCSWSTQSSHTRQKASSIAMPSNLQIAETRNEEVAIFRWRHHASNLLLFACAVIKVYKISTTSSSFQSPYLNALGQVFRACQAPNIISHFELWRIVQDENDRITCISLQNGCQHSGTFHLLICWVKWIHDLSCWG